MAEVHLENITKNFREITALENLSLTVQNGEFFVILGQTGAGKTTTLRTVAGLERPDRGRILIDNEDKTHSAPATRDVAFVFQQYSLYPHYTVFENLAFPLKAPGRGLNAKEIEERVTRVAKQLKISSKLSNKATELSGGEMQRVSIGRALVREPAIFLMDEPLSSLDAKLREELRGELKRLHRELGATIIYVTHDQIEALTLASRIAVLHEGRLRQIGTPRQIYADPDDTLVAGTLGSPAINLIAAEKFNMADTNTALVGIRPEDVHLADNDHEDIATSYALPPLDATVLQVEQLGAEDVVLFDWQGQHLRTLLDPRISLNPGDKWRLRLAEDKLMLFDQEGQRLRTGPEQSRTINLHPADTQGGETHAG